MQNDKLENQIEFLLSAALQKCGDIHEAEDLTQETLMAALSFMSNGHEILDLRAWLLTVLSHKWNDSLRKKYRRPAVLMGEDFEIADDSYLADDIEKNNEAEHIRKTIAFLGRVHRDVIVRHYMNGESVADIAKSLGVPDGTVKRRLHDGREQIKKGFDNMEKYSAQSYKPITLYVTNSGNCGINNEPTSLVRNDLLAQNILWAAYENPLTVEEISNAIGVPCAYVEPVVAKLVNGELMKSVKNRYYTDFIIFTVKDKGKYIPAQINFVKTYFKNIWTPINVGLEKLRNADFYKRFNADERNSLDLYFAFRCLCYGIYDIVVEFLHEDQVFPFRKDGGRWIAFGNVFIDNQNNIEILKHSYSGERHCYYNNLGIHKVLQMHVYGADGFPTRNYWLFPNDIPVRNNDNRDNIVARLLYTVYSGINPEQIGFNTEYLKLIPWLTDCKILRSENGKPKVNVPILNENEFKELFHIWMVAKSEMTGDVSLKEAMSDFIKDKQTIIPKHLKSVPLQKRYMFAFNSMLFATIREAMSKGLLYDGKYDEENQHPCPMVLVIE